MIMSLISFLLTTSVFASQLIELNVDGEILGHEDISAISCIEKSICLIASDETNELQMVSIKGKDLKVIKQSISLGKFKKENDIEGLTNDGKSFYAVGSHGLSRKKDKYQKSRYQIFKISIDLNGKVQDIKTANLESIISSNQKLKPFFKKSLKKNGVNIEGLAFYKNRLFVGFRGPVIEGRAQILSFDSNAYWKGERVDSKLMAVDLKNNRAIRSLEIINDKFYIVAGNNDKQKRETSELVISDMDLKSLSFHSVPYDTYKLEGFDLKQDFKIYVYDSVENGLPILENNN